MRGVNAFFMLQLRCGRGYEPARALHHKNETG
jgi:hypothetical protein